VRLDPRGACLHSRLQPTNPPASDGLMLLPDRRREKHSPCAPVPFGRRFQDGELLRTSDPTASLGHEGKPGLRGRCRRRRFPLPLSRPDRSPTGSPLRQTRPPESLIRPKMAASRPPSEGSTPAPASPAFTPEPKSPVVPRAPGEHPTARRHRKSRTGCGICKRRKIKVGYC
jgi:hypothetical protein